MIFAIYFISHLPIPWPTPFERKHKDVMVAYFNEETCEKAEFYWREDLKEYWLQVSLPAAIMIGGKITYTGSMHFANTPYSLDFDEACLILKGRK